MNEYAEKQKIEILESFKHLLKDVEDVHILKSALELFYDYGSYDFICAAKLNNL